MAVIRWFVLGTLAAAPALAQDALPLPRGFYVASDTPCGGASNATLMLYHGTGFNAARSACEFSRLTPLGGGRYGYAETCNDIAGGGAYENLGAIVLTGPSSLRFAYDGGSTYDARWCDQRDLPEMFRENDISHILN